MVDENIYLKEIKDFPILSKEEEIELFRLSKQGDKKAREKIINSNLKLVVSIAKRYTKYDFYEIVQEGSLGLIRATDDFDPSLNNKFSTYATWWIRQRITRYIQDKSSTIRKPAYLYDNYSSIKKIKEKFIQENKREPTYDELSAATGFSVEEIYNLDNDFSEITSLDTPVGEDEDNLGEIISDKSIVLPEDFLEQKEFDDRFEILLSTLSDVERRIIKLRFGIEDGVAKTLEETSHIMSMSKERTRQLETKALIKLRNPHRKAFLKGMG